MQIKAFTLVILATSASAFPKQNWARSAKNETAPAKVIPHIPIAAAGTAPLNYGAAPSGYAAVGTGVPSSIAAAGVPTVAKPTLPLGTGHPYPIAPLGTGHAYPILNTTVPPTATNGEDVPALTAAPAPTAETTPGYQLTYVTDNLLTYTQGTGNAQVVKTLTIQKTRTLTLTVAKNTPAAAATTPMPIPTPYGYGGDTTSPDETTVAKNTPAAAATTPMPIPTPYGYGGDTTSPDETTVTLKTTRTHTVTKTRQTGTAATSAAPYNSAPGSGLCGAPITSTITEKSTVYVTVPAAAATSAPSPKEAAVSSTKPTMPLPTGYGNGTAPGLSAPANGTLANAGYYGNGTARKPSYGKARYINTAGGAMPTLLTRRGAKA